MLNDELQKIVDRKCQEALDHLSESFINSPRIQAMRAAQSLLYNGEISPQEELEMICYAETLPAFGENQ